jgi:hypothetical protein
LQVAEPAGALRADFVLDSFLTSGRRELRSLHSGDALVAGEAGQRGGERAGTIIGRVRRHGCALSTPTDAKGQVSANQDEMRSAIMIVGRFVFADGMVGMIEASAT